MIEHPRAEELIAAVADWSGTIRPQLQARDSFLARAAQNALGIVSRELTRGPVADEATVAGLSGLLGCEGELDELTSDLCSRLRAGELDAATPGLLAVLSAMTDARLAIDQPKYAGIIS